MTGTELVRAAPLRTAVDGLRNGTLDAAGFLIQTLDRIGAIDQRVRAFLPEPGRRQRLLGELVALDAADGGRLPLRGLPVAVKDLYRVDGLPTQAGSRLPQELFACRQSWIVSALRRAGCVVAGKTQMDEFGCSEPSPTRNPHDLARTPGGSSSGSAAAVASGMVPLAIGSQTQRSLIGPAAFCGVVGFKPSYGRIPYDGVPLARSADTVGVLAQDVAGIELVMRILLRDWRDPATPDRPALGLATGPLFSECLPADTWFSLTQQVSRLRRAGYVICPAPVVSDAATRHWIRVLDDLLLAELADAHRRWFASYAELYRPRTAAAIRAGLAISPTRCDRCRAELPQLRADIERAMTRAGIDAWICPSSLGPAPVGLDHTGYTETTLLWSWAGMPCVSMPTDGSADGLPRGLQLVGRFGADESVLHWAAGLAAHLTVGLENQGVW